MNSYSRRALDPDNPLRTDQPCAVCGEPRNRPHPECAGTADVLKHRAHRKGRAGRNATRYPPKPAMREGWVIDALCRTYPNPDLWFAEERAEQAQAIAVCQACPVREACEAWAMRAREDWGIWGGLTPSKRRKLRRRRAA